jgi:Uri superfamily endonuclease
VPKTIKNNSGVYLLELRVKQAIRIGAKKFLNKEFETGFYYYSGSAQKNLGHRIKRHLRKKKITHWHIDHLTSNAECEMQTIFIAYGAEKDLECEFVETLLKKFNMNTAAPGFGNGDCRVCDSHLLYSAKKIDHSHFISLYQSIERLIPSSKETF